MPIIDQREMPIEIGPLIDGVYCFIAPKAKPLVTQGGDFTDERWYVAVVGFGTRGKQRGVSGWFPVRAFDHKEDAVCLHDMLLSGVCQWQDATTVPIKDGKRGLIWAVGSGLTT